MTNLGLFMIENPELIDEQACYGLYGVNIIEPQHQSAPAAMHQSVLKPWLELVDAAQAAGFSPRIVSGYRDFNRQLNIWNNKASGQRILLNDDGQVLDVNQLSLAELVQALMRFSAIPGASRHHWGSDIDIYDAAAVPDDYEVQLTPQEVSGNGVFSAFHNWLDRYLESSHNPGFFRPYQIDTGGVAPERWHLSFAPVARHYQQRLNQQGLLAVLTLHQPALLEYLQTHMSQLWQSHIWVDWNLYPVQYQ